MRLRGANYLYDPLIGNFLSWFLAAIIASFYINGKTDNPILPVIAFLVGSVWTINLHAYRQAYLIEVKKVYINHNKTFLIRGIVITIVSFLSHLLIVSPNMSEMILPAIGCAVYLSSIVWLLFDFLLNYHRGLPWDYRTKGKNRPETDKIFAEKKAFWIASKAVLFLLAMLLYYRTLTWV